MLALPLFAALIALIVFGSQLFVVRLKLIALTRDYTLLLARNEPSLHATPAVQLLELRRLAARTPGLDAKNISFILRPLGLPGLRDIDTGPVAGLVQAALLGQTVSVRYTLHWRGLLGRLFPAGLTLQEDMAFQGDPWKHPWQRVIQRYLLAH